METEEGIFLHTGIIRRNSSIKEAVNTFLENPAESLAVVSEGDDSFLGLLEKDTLLRVLGAGESPEKPVSSLALFQAPKFDLNRLPEVTLLLSLRRAVLIDPESRRVAAVFEANLFLESYRDLFRRISESEKIKDLYKAHSNNIDLRDTITALIINALDSSEELTKILRYSSDSIYVTDGNGKTLFANKAFEEISGISGSDVLGKKVQELEKLGTFTPSVTSLVLKEKRKITVIQELKNGTMVIATGVPIFNEKGEIYRVVSNSKDIRELKILGKYLEDLFSRDMKEKDALPGSFASLVCESDKMRQIMNLVATVAAVDTTILITGESGVGKGVIARLIHDSSPRAAKKFVQINCGAIPELLLESELFGYEGGAFTGAKKGGKPGLFEIADGGTLFFDEIGELPYSLQVKLLNAIQSQQIVRVGGVEPINVDVRIISATNRNLEQLVREKKFRLDLYYRLHVVPILLPPLRDRREDIIPLSQVFLTRYNQKYGKTVKLSSDFYEELLTYQWPGNIRELENLIERVVVTSKTDKVSCEEIAQCLALESVATEEAVSINRIIPLSEAMEEVERALVKAVYSACKNTYAAARILGISQSGAQRKIQKYIKNKTETEETHSN